MFFREKHVMFVRKVLWGLKYQNQLSFYLFFECQCRSFSCHFLCFSTGDTLGYPVCFSGDTLDYPVYFSCRGYFGLSRFIRILWFILFVKGYFGLSHLVRILWFIRFVACLCLLLLEDVLPLAVECLIHQLFISFNLLFISV